MRNSIFNRVNWCRFAPAARVQHTLDANKKNRGLFFDVEMTPYCENGPTEF